MSQTAPADPLAPVTAAELRRVVAWSVDRIIREGSVVSCSGCLDSAPEAVLYAYLMDRSPDTLAEVYAANERRIAGWL